MKRNKNNTFAKIILFYFLYINFNFNNFTKNLDIIIFEDNYTPNKSPFFA